MKIKCPYLLPSPSYKGAADGQAWIRRTHLASGVATSRSNAALTQIKMSWSATPRGTARPYDSLTCSRLDTLESQMSTVHAKLDGIVLLLEQFTSQKSASVSAGVPESPAKPVAPNGTSPKGAALGDSALLENFVRWINELPPTVLPNGDIAPAQPQPPLPTASSRTSDLHESDEDDPLDDAVRMQSLRTLTQREEAARLRLEGHQEVPPMPEDPGTVESMSSAGTGVKGKRPREEGSTTERLVRRKGDLSRSFMDPVQQGVVSEQQGRELFVS